MIKKILWGLILIILTFYMYTFCKTSCMTFIYSNPYIETKGFPYIGKTLYHIDNVLNSTKFSLLLDGKYIKYLYSNPYGSGFLRNNPIPNDLDYSIGIDLGTYKYNGKNTKEIATKIVDKIDLFYFYFTNNIFSENENGFYSTVNPLDMLRHNTDYRNKHISDIENYLNNVLQNKRYLKLTAIPENEENITNVMMPYLMNSDEILIQNSKQLILYSDTIEYNNKMPHYLRELSVMPEFYAKIKTAKTTKNVEFVPEVHWGTKMQLSRRCFGSTVFNNLYSLKYIKNVNWLNNDQDYIYARKLSFIRHLNEIENLSSMKKSPVKILKRIMQTAEMIHPLLSDKEYNDAQRFVFENLNNRDVQILNEIMNIYGNLENITKNTALFSMLKHSLKIKTMIQTAENLTNELIKRNNINAKTISELKAMNKYLEDNILISENIEFSSTDFKQKNEKLVETIVGEMNKIVDTSRIQYFANLFSNIYYKAGYHKVKIIWYDKDKMAIIKDDFTKNITDLKSFISDNYFPEEMINKIKFVTSKEAQKLPDKGISYNTSVIYGVKTPEYKIFEKALLDDKVNFNTKLKFVIFK